jgi:hypothetical protein
MSTYQKDTRDLGKCSPETTPKQVITLKDK